MHDLLDVSAAVRMVGVTAGRDPAHAAVSLTLCNGLDQPIGR